MFDPLPLSQPGTRQRPRWGYAVARHVLSLIEQSNATEPGDDIVAFGDNSIGEIEKLMEELRTARDYLRSEGERVRRINAHYAHLTRTASASVKIIAESMGKWRVTEMEPAT